MKTIISKIFLTLFVFTFSTNTSFAQLSVSLTFSSYGGGNNISCFGGSNGWVTATPSGGTSPYTYQWSNSATTQTISNVAASYYVVTVTDAASNTATSGVTLREPAQLNMVFTRSSYPNSYNVSCYQCFNGSITNTPSGGVSSYTFLWSDGPTTQNRSSLGGGSYVVTITDANSCTKTSEVTMTEPPKDSWGMTGNAGSNPSTQYIGTSDNTDLVFRTNALERMRIKADGKITIAQETSIDRLKVSRIVSPDSLIYFGDSTIVFQLWMNRIYGDYNGSVYGGTAIGLSYPKGTHSVAIGPNNMTNGVGSIALGQKLETSAAAAYSVIIGQGPVQGSNRFLNSQTQSLMVGFNSDIPTLYVGPSNGSGTIGKIGIGTSDPKEVFQIGDEFAFHSVGTKRIARNIWWDVAASQNKRIVSGYGAALSFDINGDIFLSTCTTGTANSTATITDAMHIRNNGKIGIGMSPSTSSSSIYKLYVEGGIATRDVKVMSGTFPDYVFEENYLLPSLSEVESFIKANKHLPEIPSAKEVEGNDGFEVGDMQVRLLKKVEELTLYIIEQNKKIEALEKKVFEVSGENK